MTRRVLILGSRPLVALAASRALGRAGYEVAVVAPTRDELAARSRWVRRFAVVPAITDTLTGWRDGVHRLVDDLAPDVVLATSDSGVIGILHADFPGPTSPGIRPEHIPLVDKYQLREVCRVLGAPYPDTTLLADEDADPEVAATITGPTVIKAARPAVVVGDRAVLLRGATVVGDGATALAAIRRIRAKGGTPIVQAHLDGRKLQAVVIRRAAATSIRLAFTVEREFPRVGGGEATLRTVSTSAGPGAHAVAILERLADHLGYDGILQAEFYVDGEGVSHLIDVNPRLWGSLAFAELLGLRMTERIVRDALGLPAPAAPPITPGRRYHRLAREVSSLVHGELTVRQLVGAIRVGDVWDVMDPADPLPDLLWLRRGLRRQGRERRAAGPAGPLDRRAAGSGRRRPRRGRATRLELALKRAMDVAGAIVGLIVLAPVLLATAAALLLAQGRPILFCQPRPGIHGRIFTVIKFRTMRNPRPGEVWFRSDAERVTRIGRILRETSLDELPQLVNVLRGEMSLVGPRPLLTAYLGRYTPDEERRHDVRPGITGWAAVNGRTASRFEDRLALDTWYVDNWTLLLDLRIIARTIAQVVRRTDATAVQRDDDIDFPERFLTALEAGAGESGEGRGTGPTQAG